MLRLTIAEYGYWHAAKEYACEHLTDGFIPTRALGVIFHDVTAARGQKMAVALVEAGLWERRRRDGRSTTSRSTTPPGSR
jgi:hypothetical protein